MNKEFLKLVYGHQFINTDEIQYSEFNEANCVTFLRIKKSLPAMNSFILNQEIVDFQRLSPHTPLVLSLGISDELGQFLVEQSDYSGRVNYVEILGKMKFQDSFNHLRDIYFHDNSEYMKAYALEALGGLENELILPEIRNQFMLKDLDSLPEYTKFLSMFKHSKLALTYLNEVKNIYLFDYLETGDTDDLVLDSRLASFAFDLLTLPKTQELDLIFSDLITYCKDNDFYLMRRCGDHIDDSNIIRVKDTTLILPDGSRKNIYDNSYDIPF